MAGFSLSLTCVKFCITAASPDGWKPCTTSVNLRPITLTSSRSPLTTGLPSRFCARYSSPPSSFSGWVGASVTLVAGFGTTFLIPSFSSRPTPAFFLVTPSIRIVPLFSSSGYPT